MFSNQLKSAILQAAFKGDLIKHFSSDGDANDLMKEIEEERLHLVKLGKLNSSDPIKFFPSMEFSGSDKNLNALYFRLGDLFSIETGANFSKNDQIFNQQGVRVLRGGNILNNKVKLFDNDTFIPKNLISKEMILRSNDMITPSVTSIENIGKVAFIDQDLDNVVCGGFIFLLRPIFQNSINSKYLFWILNSNPIKQILKSKTKKSGQAFYNLGKQRIQEILIPILTLSEQKRIVSKIEELFVKIEELENNESKLNDLVTKFPDQLKASILQAAIQGKLTDQLPSDGHASDLIKEIEKEKSQLVKQGKIKASIIVDPINEDEIPFEIPKNWCWTTLSQVAYIISGTSYGNADIVQNSSNSIRIVRGGNIIDGDNKLVFFPHDVYVTEKLNDSSKYLTQGDIVIVSSTGSKTAIGKPAPVNENFPRTQIGAFLRIIRPKKYISDYLKLIFFSNYYRSYISKISKGTNINNLKNEYLLDFLIPLPPLNEQKRIVNKIEEIQLKINSLT